MALIRGRLLRWAMAGAATAAALAALYLHPLRIHLGVREIELGRPHPGWHEGGLGEKRRDPWGRAVVLAIAFAGMAGPMVLALPSMAFVALALRPRARRRLS